MATASIQNELVRVASGLSGLTLSVAEFAVHIISGYRLNFVNSTTSNVDEILESLPCTPPHAIAYRHSAIPRFWNSASRAI